MVDINRSMQIEQLGMSGPLAEGLGAGRGFAAAARLRRSDNSSPALVLS